MPSRTMADIARRYDEQRNSIIEAIHNGHTSASMSGIEYYPKPWAELDVSDFGDCQIISTNLTWDEAEKVHTHDGLRILTKEELDLHARKSALFFKPHSERKDELEEIYAKLRELRARNNP